ncbi:MAG: glycosyltransferase [Candidatus Omnitrophica bacterium]|nr:glycosyltransferase [Candidatus Omnitrophota bacterium]
MDESPFISVVIPVKNEAAILERCLASLRRLDYPAERLEVIVADGGSTDDTRRIAESLGARVVINDKQVVVSGRNRGFEAARGEFVAFTDADCVFESGWLRNGMQYFKEEKVGGVGGPTLMPQDSTAFERAVNLFFVLAGFLKITSHRQEAGCIQEVNDIPGCNAIFRAQALREVMPVDEGLLTAEDVWMNYRVRLAGYTLIWAPDVTLWHYRRSSPRMFMRQVYRFAIGRFQVAKRSLRLIKPLHILAALTIPLLLALDIALQATGALWVYAVLAALFIFDCVFFAFLHMRSARSAFYFPFVVLLFCCCWSAGALRELLFPMKQVAGR